MDKMILLKEYDYVAQKIKNLEHHTKNLPDITPEHFEPSSDAPSMVAADASRNSYQLEAATIFEVRGIATGNDGTYIAEHIDVVPVPYAQDIFTRLIMEALEHRILARYIIDQNPQLVFLDGSLMTPTGIILQYPDPKTSFRKEYAQNKETYDTYFKIFEEVLDDTFELREGTIPIGLYNLQFKELSDEYNDVKKIHEKITSTLMFKKIYPEAFNAIQALAYYEYMYETNRLYREVFKRNHIAITKTNIASNITKTFLDKFVARKLFEKYDNYPAMIRFRLSYDEGTKPAAPEYFDPVHRFKDVMKVFYEPPNTAYYAIDRTANIYVAETYNNLEDILSYVAYISPPAGYYPIPLEKAHHLSVVRRDDIEADVALIRNISLSEELDYHVRKPLL